MGDENVIVKIEKGVPLVRHGATKYPWRSMEVGDSFFVPTKRAKFAGQVGVAQRTTGFKFSTRCETKDGVEGCRVWRIE